MILYTITYSKRERERDRISKRSFKTRKPRLIQKEVTHHKLNTNYYYKPLSNYPNNPWRPRPHLRTNNISPNASPTNSIHSVSSTRNPTQRYETPSMRMRWWIILGFELDERGEGGGRGRSNRIGLGGIINPLHCNHEGERETIVFSMYVEDEEREERERF